MRQRLSTLTIGIAGLLVGLAINFYSQPVLAQATARIFGTLVGSTQTPQRIDVDSSNRLQVDIAADSVGIGGGTQYAEDVASAGADTGTAALCVQDATPGNTAGADGDWTFLQCSAGYLFSSVINAGTFVVQENGAALTALQLIDNLIGALFVDDADFTDGTSSFLLAGCVAEAAAPSTVVEGDVGACAMTLNRALKVTLFNSTGTELTSTEVAEDAAETAGVTGPMVLGVRRDAPASSTATTGENATFNLSALGALYSATIDPCSFKAKSYYVVNIASAQGSTVGTEIANAVASEYWYICSVNLVTNAANVINIATDDTDGCGSLTAGLNGGNSSTTGWYFAANGGLTLGNGDSTVMKAATANHYLCISQSASTQLSGTIAYVSAP